MDLILAGLVSTMVVLMKLQHRELDKLSICRLIYGLEALMLLFSLPI